MFLSCCCWFFSGLGYFDFFWSSFLLLLFLFGFFCFYLSSITLAHLFTFILQLFKCFILWFFLRFLFNSMEIIHFHFHYGLVRHDTCLFLLLLSLLNYYISFVLLIFFFYFVASIRLFLASNSSLCNCSFWAKTTRYTAISYVWCRHLIGHACAEIMRRLSFSIGNGQVLAFSLKFNNL